MKISIIGTGYVGLVTGACFAQLGNTVTCIDIDEKKIENLKKGILPIYEPGLEDIVIENSAKGNLFFTTDIKAGISSSKAAFIAVGTPMGEDGSADLKYVLNVATEIGRHMSHPIIIVNKSTVPVGTAERVRKQVKSELEKRNVDIHFSIASNPEFLKEGAAINDFMKPDRIVIGADDEETISTLRDLYKPFVQNHDRIIEMDLRSSEMTKYAANAMLATKISFINEIANICERVGADINKVRVGIGSDNRIGYSFIYPGAGYGGSCFPKDVRALEKTATDHNYTPKLLQAVEKVNNDQKKVIPNKVISYFGEDLKGKTFALWGLAFKPETDDMREASSITVINELTRRGALVQAYDPKAISEAQDFYFQGNKSITYCSTKYDALKGADALILITEWREFKSPDFEEIGKLLNRKLIFDGRNQYSLKMLETMGFEYFQIGCANK